MPRKKRKTETQEKRITVRVSKRLMAVLEEACREKGLVKASDAVRVAIHDAYKKKAGGE